MNVIVTVLGTVNMIVNTNMLCKMNVIEIGTGIGMLEEMKMSSVMMMII
jgi:16S rRNA A1518/A1519 N6-dimethyltransferase RsmA/KsgA/DIM1 with predicted DNA glycosylase/AP lyase activity